MPIPLIYQDDELLVVSKPAGLLAVPGRGADKQDCLVARVQREHAANALIVHRLDQATSGLMLFARGAAMQSALSRLFARRAVEKRYVAIVQGELKTPRLDDDAPAEAWPAIELPLIVDWPNRPLQKVDAQLGKPALTHYRAIAFDAQTNTTRVDLAPVTGRTHQLRVHMQALGHPIVGDGLYGPPEAARQARMLLHATRLELMHPRSGLSLGFVSLPDF